MSSSETAAIEFGSVLCAKFFADECPLLIMAIARNGEESNEWWFMGLTSCDHSGSPHHGWQRGMFRTLLVEHLLFRDLWTLVR